jgi:hypothetical protein
MMPELGSKPMNTMLDEPDGKVYPTLYLSDADARAILTDAQPGDERMVTGTVRVASVSKSKNGEISGTLEFVSLDMEDKDKPTAATKMYPTMVES